jgi:hypothetical protein
LNNALEIGVALDVFDGLNIGKWNGFSFAERDVGVGSVEDAEFLKGDLDGEGETADTALVDLRRGVENDEKGEEKSDEVGVADEMRFRAVRRRFRQGRSRFRLARIRLQR